MMFTTQLGGFGASHTQRVVTFSPLLYVMIAANPLSPRRGEGAYCFPAQPRKALPSFLHPSRLPALLVRPAYVIFCLRRVSYTTSLPCKIETRVCRRCRKKICRFAEYWLNTAEEINSLVAGLFSPFIALKLAGFITRCVWR